MVHLIKFKTFYRLLPIEDFNAITTETIVQVLIGFHWVNSGRFRHTFVFLKNSSQSSSKRLLIDQVFRK